MKKNILVTISLVFVSLLSSAQEIKKMTYFMDDAINGVISNGAFDVQLSEGDKTGVTIDIDQELLEKLNVSKTEEGFVRIDLPSDISKIFSKKSTPLVKIVVSKLNYLSVSGSSVIAKGEFTCDGDFRALITGGTYLAYVKLNCDKATWDIKGKAKVEECKINATESCDIISNESASSAFVVNTAVLTASASTISKLDMSGEATKSAKIESSGTAAIDMLRLATPFMRVSVLGMSKVKADVSVEADVTVGGTASFRYTGNGKISGDSKGIKPL